MNQHRGLDACQCSNVARRVPGKWGGEGGGGAGRTNNPRVLGPATSAAEPTSSLGPSLKCASVWDMDVCVSE
jgi:hypothetical protein